MDNTTEFSGKKVLITGAAGGIGQAVIAALRAKGASIAAADTKAMSCDADCFLKGDLLDPEALGGLDIIINNAGVITRGPVTDTSDADWKLSVGVNIEAPFRICRAAIPLMAASGGGVIVNVSSCWGGKAAGPNHALYCMTKAALASLTEAMGLDHAHQNIRVNAVCPNEVNTPMLRSGFEKRGFDADSAVAELGKTVPLGRIAEPEDIADVIVFLASDAARYMTGTLVEVNGGKAVS